MERIAFAKELCLITGGVSGLPVMLYENGEKIFEAGFHALPRKIDFSPLFRELTLPPLQRISYRLVEDCFVFASVYAEKSNLLYLVGPALTGKATEPHVRSLMLQCGAVPEDYSVFREFFATRHILNFTLVLQILRSFYLSAEGENISLEELLRRNDAPAYCFTEMFDHGEKLQYGEELRHTDYDFETEMLFLIRKGRTKNLIKFLADTPVGEVGKLAGTTLRQEKDNAIISIALATRAAIASGLNRETALYLSDIAIQKIEICSTPNECNRINYEALIEITQRVEALQNNGCTNPLINRVIEYIGEHIYGKIVLEEVAEELHTSRPFLSTKFKEEVGIPFNDYVLKLKIVEAKKLLLHTGRSLSEIAGALGFSTQSHFQNTFKRLTGSTPAAYRKNGIEE